MLLTPHFEQSKDGYCLPACVRMVLAGFGRTVTEQQLAQLLGTKRFGTPISNVNKLQSWQYEVIFQSFFALDQLKRHLDAGIPIIAQVWPMMLTYWLYTPAGSHVVVIIGYDNDGVFINDPAMQTAPHTLTWDAFLAAWAEFDETAAVILP